MTNIPSPPADLHLSIGAHVLHALPDAEDAAFQAHLTECDPCADEVGGLRSAAAMLGAAEAVRPPSALRDRILAAAATTRQEPPELRAVGGVAGGTALGSGRRRAAGAPHAAWYRRPTSWLAAAAAVIVIGGGVTWSVLAGRDAPLTAGQQLEQCITADRAAATMAPSVGTGGSLTRSDSCNAVMVTLPAMQAPPAGKAYQLWMIKGDAPTSMGLVPSLSGAVLPVAITADDSTVAVTVEPAGGSAQPTGKPIWAVPLH